MLSVKLLNTRRTTPAKSPSKSPAQGPPEEGNFDHALAQAQGKHADASSSRHATPEKPEPRKSKPSEATDQPTEPDACAAAEKPQQVEETPEPQPAQATRDESENVEADQPVEAAAAAPVPQPTETVEAAAQSIQVAQAQSLAATAPAPTPAPESEAIEGAPQPRDEKLPTHHAAPVITKKADAPAPEPEISEPAAEAAEEAPPAKPHQPSKFAAHIAEAHEKSSNAAASNHDAAQSQSQLTPEPLPQSIAKAIETIAAVSPAPEAASSETAPANPGIPLPQGASVTLSHDASPAESAPAAQESPQSTTPETFEQIVLGLKGKLDARTGKAEIRLDPPNLGRVNVSVSLNNGTLTAEFQSASDVVRNLLKDNIDKLKSVLQGQGVAVDRLAVEAPAAPATAGGNSAQQQSFGSATHDGRSAGQYQQNGRQQQPPAQGDSFARLFRQTQEAPIDMVA